MSSANTQKLPPELVELASQVGQFIEYWGFKNIHGQIWLMIYLSAEPLDATTLVKKLGVSKALVSLAIKDLLEYDVIQLVGRGSGRKVFYQSNPDQIEVISNVLRKRERKMLATIHSSIRNFKKVKMEDFHAHKMDMKKAGDLEEMVTLAEHTLDLLISNNLSFE